MEKSKLKCGNFYHLKDNQYAVVIRDENDKYITTLIAKDNHRVLDIPDEEESPLHLYIQETIEKIMEDWDEVYTDLEVLEKYHKKN